MFETFATVASVIYFVGYTVSIGMLIYAFSQLSIYAQRKANVSLSPLGIIVYLASIAWLITKAIS